MNTTQLKTVNSLALCEFSAPPPRTSVLNKSATNRIVSDAGATQDSTRVYNSVINTKGNAIGKAISLQTSTGEKIRRLGAPYPNGGVLITVPDIATAQNIYDDAMAELDVIKEDIVAEYPAIMKSTLIKLSKFAGEVRVPTATEIVSHLTMRLTILNQPVAIDNAALAGLATEVANRVRAESQRQLDELLRASNRGPIEDLKEVIKKFSEALREGQRLHLSQFDKLKAEAERVKKLNFLNLPEIQEVVDFAAEVARRPEGPLDRDARVDIAVRAESVSVKADETLAALGI